MSGEDLRVAMVVIGWLACLALLPLWTLKRIEQVSLRVKFKSKPSVLEVSLWNSGPILNSVLELVN